MYEVSTALKYLIPRLRHLSVSIISTISVFVIATVVWLTIVFFSATEDLERRWTQKLVSITAPVRLTPTNAYYRSYYYLIDGLSEASQFSHKTLSEKLKNPINITPYNPESDPGLPQDFPKPLLDEQQQLVDLVKKADEAIMMVHGVDHLSSSVFETAFANVTIHLLRADNPQNPGDDSVTSRILTQAAYLVNIDPAAVGLQATLLPMRTVDNQNLPPNTPLPQINPQGGLQLPHSALLGEGVLLPKSFSDNGVRVGDRGNFSYYVPSVTALQEQQLPFYVAGFYDPGIIPIGGKLILVSSELISLIQSASQVDANAFPTGLNVNFPNYHLANQVKRQIEANLKKLGINSFFNVETYEEYEFTKDIFQQLKSERNLFSLIALIIIVVACSNIISMLIILVHDKHKEVAVLRALGASKKSIGFIFGLCGFLMGAIGSIIGAALAAVTVKNLPALLRFLGSLQGFDVLNTTFYGELAATGISSYAFIFIMLSTAIISTCAGTITAIQASRQNTSEALRGD